MNALSKQVARTKRRNKMSDIKGIEWDAPEKTVSNSIYEDLLKEIDKIRCSKPSYYVYAARDCEVELAIEAFKHLNVYIFDRHGNYWFHGEKVEGLPNA